MLVEMTKFEGTQHGKLIASQMLDVSIRVKDVRPFAVRQMVSVVRRVLCMRCTCTCMLSGLYEGEGVDMSCIHVQCVRTVMVSSRSKVHQCF